MNTDSYFEQGHTHQVCQDYAIDGETDNTVYAVVADGCSEAIKSDFGARIVAEAFVPSIEGVVRDFSDGYNGLSANAAHKVAENYTLMRMANVSRELKLGIDPLKATLVSAIFSKKDSKLRLYMWGDGAIVLKYPDRVVTYKGFYASSAPYYLAYRLQEEAMAGFKDKFGSFNCAYSKTVKAGSNLEEFTISQQESLFIVVDDIEDMEFALVTSDGADTYRDSLDKPVDVFNEFYAFKNRGGEFVQRRMQRLKEQTADAERTHYDDISVAAINFV